MAALTFRKRKVEESQDPCSFSRPGSLSIDTTHVRIPQNVVALHAPGQKLSSNMAASEVSYSGNVVTTGQPGYCKGLPLGPGVGNLGQHSNVSEPGIAWPVPGFANSQRAMP